MQPAFFAVVFLAAMSCVNDIPIARAAEGPEVALTGQSSGANEFSAAKKQRAVVVDAAYVVDTPYVDAITGEIVNPSRPRYIVPSHDFITGPDGYPGEYAVRRASGQCVMDFGYGRWHAC